MDGREGDSFTKKVTNIAQIVFDQFLHIIIPCAIFEHIIHPHLVNFLKSSTAFYLAQHRFRNTYSWETQLLSFTYDRYCILDHASITDYKFLDFWTAFEWCCCVEDRKGEETGHQATQQISTQRVSCKLLLFKLHHLQIGTTVQVWIPIKQWFHICSCK